MSQYSVRMCSQSNIGLKRRKNEDSHAVMVDKGPLGSLFVVADGMGGHPKGDLASRLAVEGLVESFFRSPLPWWERLLYAISPGALAKRLKKAVEDAQKALCKYEVKHRECRGFGTTLSVLVLKGKKAMIASVGDSRIYMLRDGELEQLTIDDTLVQEMVDYGDLTVEDARTSPYRHVLTQALGGGFEGVHTRVLDVELEDTFLLSTDGLHDLVSHATIKEILAHGRVESICSMLVDAALRHGGRDNVTVIVVRIGPG